MGNYLNQCNCLDDPCVVCPEPESCPTPCGKDCITLAHPVISPSNSVGPCGSTGIIDIASLNDYTICGGTFSLKISYYDPVAFTQVVINQDGNIEFTTSDNAVPNQYYDIIYEANCSSGGQSIGDFGKAQVGIKDLCFAITCQSGFSCNKCNGNCEQNQIDVGFEDAIDVGFV